MGGERESFGADPHAGTGTGAEGPADAVQGDAHAGAEQLDGRGYRAGLQAAVREAGPPLALLDAEQLGLGLDAGLRIAQAVDQARRAGRPRGAANKRTGKVRDWLLSKYAHPLEHLAATYSRPVDVLAAELGCTKLEAFAHQLRAAVELAPYMEGKQPVTLDVAMRNDVTLIIPGMNAPLGDPRAIAALAAAGAIDPALLPDFADFQALPAQDDAQAGEK